MANDSAALGGMAEALKRIAHAKQTNATELDLGGLGLTEIPEALFALGQLRVLHLGYGEAARKSPFYLYGIDQKDKEVCNAVPALPPRLFTALPHLAHLDLAGNQLTALPDAIRALTSLQRLHLDGNQLTALPDAIAALTSLHTLILGGNQLTALPDAIRALTSLQRLYLNGNQLTALPDAIRALTSLQRLDLDGNPLPQPYFDSLKDGIPALFAYIASLEAGDADAANEPIREAKLLLTGEGEVGKTVLIRALRGEGDRNSDDATAGRNQTTIGVELGRLSIALGQPVTVPGGIALDRIEFNSWDFGGQQDYRILHQFFFSGDAIYLLVWKPRMGETQCDLIGWLRRIHLVAGASARVILVATHADDPHQAYQSTDILRDAPGHLTGLIKGRIDVDSLTGKNLDALKALIARIATEAPTRLPRLGAPMKPTWRCMVEETLSPTGSPTGSPTAPDGTPRPETLAYETFVERCLAAGLDKAAARTIGTVFIHELGRALYFGGQTFGDRELAGRDRHHLADLMVLDPEWLSKAIARVLLHEPLTAAGGLLNHDTLEEIWADRDGEPRFPARTYEFLVRLMQQLDVSYPVREKDGNLSIIAQRLPERVPAKLPWRLESRPPEGVVELRLQCDVGDDVPGLIPWLIAETHAYQVDDPADDTGRTLCWADGVFLRSSHDTGAFEALIQLTRRPQHRLHLVVRGQRPPHALFNELQRVIKRVLARWPGLETQFYVPCPERLANGERCDGRHPLRALELSPEHITEAACNGTADLHYNNVTRLLTGLETMFIAKRRDFKAAIDEAQAPVRADIAALANSSANAFQALLTAQSAAMSPCPRLFSIVPVAADLAVPEAIRPRGGLLSSLGGLIFGQPDQAKDAVGQHYHLQLHCEQSYLPVGEPYLFYEPPAWFSTVAPLLRLAAPMLDLAQLASADAGVIQQLQDAQEFMKSAGSAVKGGLADNIGDDLRRSILRGARDADYRQLQALLDKLDPTKAYRGMAQRRAPDGVVKWMSPSEAAFHKPIEIRVPIRGTPRPAIAN